MSSTNSTETPCTSSAVQKVKAKGASKSIKNSQALEAMEKRLDLLLARVATLENSLNELTTTFSNSDTEEDAEPKDQEVSDDTSAELSKITAAIGNLDLDST